MRSDLPEFKCPVCGGHYDCKKHWLGWTDDGKEIIPSPSRLEEPREPIDSKKHLLFKTGVTCRVYLKEQARP